MIAPSILSANFLNLGSEIEMLNNSDADYIHLDVMDGVFVPNITFGQPIIKQISTIAQKPLDTHLMIIQPERYIDEFAEAGSKIITVHYEACTHLHRTIQQIKKNKVLAGVSINPHTPVNVLESIIYDVDLVLIMSVNPGFGGQSFIHFSYEKVKQLVDLRLKKGLNFLIELDGGVTVDNARSLYEAGVDILVAGNAVFKANNPKEAITLIRNSKNYR